ncbi:hypothetical protein ES705_22892 [subsurface metagenome]
MAILPFTVTILPPSVSFLSTICKLEQVKLSCKVHSPVPFSESNTTLAKDWLLLVILVGVASESKVTVEVPGIWAIEPEPSDKSHFPAQVTVALERFKV